MTQPAQSSICPRCRSTTVDIRMTSPVPGAWTVYGCNTCSYVWRSTEPAENTDPERYPEVFRLTPAELAAFEVVPTIPPLRQS
ncbi:MAG: hypothetical protein JOZ87_12485 [Chloroflexi bacterium]|nr:hypothetical protein [Chloroflexota bacterium]